MIKNNKGVKLCFIKQKNDGGSLPSGVKVKLTVQSSGTVSSAKIPSGEWKDTDFDGCLSGAVKAIQFPPFDGDPLTITYPFPI
ncbi:MAG: AgmX/PglI C-terminal domain-containing protein [Deltaproteobacteria bacterium]|nr:AgmX/PglI C-terminal domain-containing protein [Deltaproteobacteria bacterium]